jgi:hypothetical protein
MIYVKHHIIRCACDYVNYPAEVDEPEFLDHDIIVFGNTSCISFIMGRHAKKKKKGKHFSEDDKDR